MIQNFLQIVTLSIDRSLKGVTPKSQSLQLNPKQNPYCRSQQKCVIPVICFFLKGSLCQGGKWVATNYYHVSNVTRQVSEKSKPSSKQSSLEHVVQCLNCQNNGVITIFLPLKFLFVIIIKLFTLISQDRRHEFVTKQCGHTASYGYMNIYDDMPTSMHMLLFSCFEASTRLLDSCLLIDSTAIHSCDSPLGIMY